MGKQRTGTGGRTRSPQSNVHEYQVLGEKDDNVRYVVTDTHLVVSIDLRAKGQPSGSGKNMVFATTRGGQRLLSTDVTLSLNAYRPML